LGQNRYVLLNF